MTHDEFDGAYRNNLPYLIHLASRILRNRDRAICEDLVADAVCRCLVNIDDFTVEGAASVKTWMANAVVWECKDYLRRQEEQRRASFEEAELVTDAKSLLPFSSVDMNAALDTLPREQKRIIQLLYMEGCTYKEASRQLGVPIRTIRDTEQSGLDVLRHKLEGYHG